MNGLWNLRSRLRRFNVSKGINMGEESLTKLFKIDCGDIYLQEFTVKDAESIYKIANQPEIEKFYQTGNQRKNRGFIGLSMMKYQPIKHF